MHNDSFTEDVVKYFEWSGREINLKFSACSFAFIAAVNTNVIYAECTRMTGRINFRDRH